MGNFYDRDPMAMIRYATEANQYIAEMKGIVSRVNAALQANASHLDDASQRDIQKLKDCVTEFNKQMAKYEDITRDITTKAKLAIFHHI